MCRVTQAVLGADWYFNRARWDTVDGYAPLDEVWDQWVTVLRVRAFERLNQLRVSAIVNAGEQAAAMIETDMKEATGG